MQNYFRVAGYTFLALYGLTAWVRIDTGWRHYAGLILFFFASVRVFILLKQRSKDAMRHHKGQGFSGAAGRKQESGDG